MTEEIENTRKKYKVYRKYYMNTENINNNIQGIWEYVGTTYAVSPAQAINNVKYRIMGKISQNQPLEIGGNWERGYEWKAELDEGLYDVAMIRNILLEKGLIQDSFKLSNVGNFISQAKRKLNISDVARNRFGKMYYSEEDANKIIKEFVAMLDDRKKNDKPKQIKIEDVSDEEEAIRIVEKMYQENIELKNLIKKYEKELNELKEKINSVEKDKEVKKSLISTIFKLRDRRLNNE